MGTFLKVFFGLILAALGFFVLIGSAFAAAFAGLGGFIVQFIVALALWAGAITLFAKARR
jgi:hypothetical protein